MWYKREILVNRFSLLYALGLAPSFTTTRPACVFSKCSSGSGVSVGVVVVLALPLYQLSYSVHYLCVTAVPETRAPLLRGTVLLQLLIRGTVKFEASLALSGVLVPARRLRTLTSLQRYGCLQGRRGIW
eukprot:g60412.t1